MRLSPTQRRYVWLAGSFPARVVQQGRGVRRARGAKGQPVTLYALNIPDTLVIFGYCHPLYFMESLGLFRRLQDARQYTLTDVGEAEFRRLLAKGAGLELNRGIREVEAK
jgi:hypothetical protein